MIKNYTSGVPIDRTVSKIESVLVEAGASNIMKDYAGGELKAICFTVVNPHDRTKVSIRLPANVDEVYAVLKSEVKRPRSGTLDKLKDQAGRTAWKLMQDWVEVQLSLIRMSQAEFLQVFLPYVWDGRQTFYSALKAGGFEALSDGGFKMLTAHGSKQ
jgi:hypothetical protein